MQMAAFVVTLRSSSGVMSGHVTVVHCKDGSKNSVQAVYINNLGTSNTCCAEPT